ncbi:hypothetical protein [Heyndrickxia acidiproducens]|uniref:hypothetical protein n=1 Tax=Heyndrickxia acidiproducens TaxID=1121084 RepID=UPI00037809FE|nr:hypothetical protein [Heyndrickxia acidiproducens]
MSKIELNVLFKKIQKDDKKEVLEFHIQGDTLPSSQELVQMAGNIVVLEVLESKAGTFPAEFKSIQRDSKKTALKFNVTGDSDDKMIDLYPLAGFNSKLTPEPSQMSIDEFYDGEDHESIEYNVNSDGTVEISDQQMSIDDLPEEETATTAVEIDDDDKLFD